jgi:hypothetical protein
VDGSRHELFPRAGRPGYQNIGVVPRNLAREVKNLQHGWAFAYDPMKLKVLPQLPFQRGDLVEGTLQSVAFNRFGQKIRGAPPDGFER